MKISIVTTMYNSAPYLEEFHRRSVDSVLKLTTDYEIIFVNDGSPDDSLEVALMLIEQDENIKVVDLSRNFGHHKAMMEGLLHSNGDLVFLIDSDLEEKPELLQDFYQCFIEVNCDVVYGVQKKRRGGFWEKITGEVFYSLINYLSGMNMPKNIVTARLMSRRYVDQLIQFKEHEIFLGGIFYITGFFQVPFEVEKLTNSKSTYNAKKKFEILVNAVTSFSNKPLSVIFYIGFVITLLSFVYSAYLIFRVSFTNHVVEGWTTVVVSIWLIGGVIVLFLGIIGMYISKIFTETKNRPYTIVKEVYRKQQ